MTNPCSSAVLESALAGNLPPNDEDALHRHLGECEACSAALERMAGGTALCKEAASLLVEDELDAALPPRDEWSAVDFTVEHLEPADEPNVLGRLGGYDVLEVIGHGGMGVVLKAFDRELKRCVAIKVLAPHLAQSSLAKKRFAREAQAAAAIVHPHVLAIHHVQPNGPLPFLVMPLVAGESLAERLVARGTLELTETLRIGMQAAAGLAAAHEQGLVHRDVKPANILLEKGIERAVLTDFGLARAADDVTLTRWGIIAGTPQYMSPEQARGEPLDGRSDLFSLGCVLYEMATGVSPFRTDSVLATMRRLVDEAPRAMAALNPELPPWFIGVVDRLMEKDPSRRFGSAKEVSELLEQCLAHVQQPALVPLPAGLPVSKSISHEAPAAQRRRTNRFIGGIVALLVIVFGGFAAFLMATAEPSDISGEWTGDDWGKVVLKQTASGEYAGSYTDVFGKEPGKIELKWSRIERRYNGTWSEGKDRLGKISVRPVGDEIRGAWTTNRKSDINPGTPALADLLWVRPNDRPTSEAQALILKSGPVTLRSLNYVSLGTNSVLNLESGQVFSPPEDVRDDFGKAMAWVRSNDADLVACWDGGGRGLRIIDGLAISPARWDATPKEVAEKINDMERQLAEYKRTIPGLQGPREKDFSNLWADGKDKPAFYIKTRNGKLGIVQITGMTEDPRMVTFRYKLLMDEATLQKGARENDRRLKQANVKPIGSDQVQKSWHPSPPAPVEPTKFRVTVVPSPYGAKGSEPIVPWDLAQQVKVGQTKAQVIELFRKRGHSAPADEDAQGRYLLFATNGEQSGEVALRIDAQGRVAEISFKEIKNEYGEGANDPPNGDRLQLAGTKATKQLLDSLENDDVASALNALQKILALEPDIIAQLRGDDAHEALIKLGFQQLRTIKQALERRDVAEAKRIINELAPTGAQIIAEIYGFRPNEIKTKEPRPPATHSDAIKLASPNVEATVIGIDGGGYPERVALSDSGHAIKLSTPQGHDWNLTQIQVYASRYGDDDPKGLVHIYICDSNGKTSKDLTFPYSAFHMGEPGWVKLTLPEPVHVTDPFIVEVMTNSTKEAGIYLHHDGQRDTEESYEVARGEYKPFKKGNWRIRARLERTVTPVSERKHGDPDATIPTQKSWHPSPPAAPATIPGPTVLPSPYAAKGEPVVPWDLAQQVKVGQTKAQVNELFRKRGHSAPAHEDAQSRYLLFATIGEHSGEVALRIDAQGRVAEISYKEIKEETGEPISDPPNDDRLQLAGTKAAKELLASLENDDTAGALKVLNNILDLESDIVAQAQGDDAREALVKLGFQQLETIKLALERRDLVEAKRIINELAKADTTVTSVIAALCGGSASIAWGKPSPNGLQVGVQLSPDKKMYLNGEQVLPAFYYRNVGDQLLDTSEVNLTKDRFYDKLVAIDAAGQEIPIEQDRKPGNPVWEPKSLRPGAMYELLGLPLLLGKGERNPSTGEAAIRVLPGASVRLHFVLRSPVKGDKKSLTTGDIEFAIFASKANAELKEQSERRKSSNPTKDQGTSHSIIRSGDQVMVTLKAKKPETFDNTTIYTVDDHGQITLDSRVGSPTIEIAGLDESKAAEAIQKSLKHPDSWEEVRVERGANLP